MKRQNREPALFFYRFKHSNAATLLPPLHPSTFKEWPTRTEQIKRRRHIGSINRCVVSNHHAAEVAHCQALQYNMLTQNCYSSWFDNFLLVGRMQPETDVLIDALKALRVLHSHEELLSQVFKGFICWQIQAVETGKTHSLHRLNMEHILNQSD